MNPNDEYGTGNTANFKPMDDMEQQNNTKTRSVFDYPSRDNSFVDNIEHAKDGHLKANSEFGSQHNASQSQQT
jgi:hypothetical protein